jgi:hypothetical protein
MSGESINLPQIFLGSLILFGASQFKISLSPPSTASALESNQAMVFTSGISKTKPVPTIEHTARFIEDCSPSPTALGTYKPAQNTIHICQRNINEFASGFNVSPEAVRRYTIAHESAHASGELTEDGADKIAIDYMAAIGDWEAIEARSKMNNPKYAGGTAYALQVLKTKH